MEIREERADLIYGRKGSDNLPFQRNKVKSKHVIITVLSLLLPSLSPLPLSLYWYPSDTFDKHENLKRREEEKSAEGWVADWMEKTMNRQLSESWEVKRWKGRREDGGREEGEIPSEGEVQ